MDDKSRENPREIKLRLGSSLDDIVSTLRSLRIISAEQFFVDFNGVKLYADLNLTLDEAYQQVYGKTRSEFFSEKNAILEEHAKEIREYREEAKALIAKRFEEGKKYIYPEREEEWRNQLNALAKYVPGVYDGRLPDLMIDCMKRLENGEEFQSVLDFVKEVGEGSLDLVSQIMPFSKVGPEFYEYVYRKEDPTIFTDTEVRNLENKKEENRKLAELHKSKSKREVSTSEIGEVASGATLGSITKAMNAVTNSKDEPVIKNDGPSHDDE